MANKHPINFTLLPPSNRDPDSIPIHKNLPPSLPPIDPPPVSPSSLLLPTPMSKTSGAAKKKNKKKALQARNLISPQAAFHSIHNHNHLNHSLKFCSTASTPISNDMIGAYPAEDNNLTPTMSPVDEDDRSSSHAHSLHQSNSQSNSNSHSMHPSLAAATRQTQEDLLATANDLYRQIETAAAAALASHLSPQSLASIGNNHHQNLQNNNFINNNNNNNNNSPHAPHPDDDAYWTSLPAHLRSFIRSALPLAAGHSSSINNQSQSSIQNHPTILPNLSSFAHATGMITSSTNNNSNNNNNNNNNSINQQAVPQLSSEQMAAAAEQLARVVQSHDWGRAVSTAAQQAGLAHNNNNNNSSSNNNNTTSPINHIINGSSTRSSHSYPRDGNPQAATVSVTGGTVTGTIPLGSFTLPLPIHSHSDQHPSAISVSEPVYYTGETTIVTSSMADKLDPNDGLLDDGYYSDEVRGIRNELNLSSALLDSCHHNPTELAANQPILHSSPATTTAASAKKKKKNKKKKSANPNSSIEPLSHQPVPATQPRSAPPPSPTLPNLPMKASSLLQPPSKKTPAPHPPGPHPTTQPPSNALAAPPSRLPPVPPTANAKKKLVPPSPLPNNLRDLNNSASSSTITNTTSNNPAHQPTEREQIRDFWLTLNQEERANLVKIEKDAVLKKMKEQQRHSCSCAVCGRKRLAIEQELEVLYDAYYDELENYAEASKKYYGSDLKARAAKGLPAAYPKPPGPGPFPGSVDVVTTTTTQPANAVASKKAVPKPTRDHKNIRPRPQHAVPQQTHPTPQAATINNAQYQQPQTGAKRALPPPAQLKKHTNPASDHDHTHSPSCPHHPHHHGPNHFHHAPATNNRGKGVANVEGIPPAGHPRMQPHRTEEEMFADEEGEEEEEEEEDYDEDEEEEYDEDEEEEGEFEDDDEIPALEEVPSETRSQQAVPPKKLALNGTTGTYTNKKLVNGADKPNGTGAAPGAGTGAGGNNGDLFGFGNSLTVKGILTVADDLLRNDGQKFLEMMESLADKRIQRERDAAENLLAGLEEDDNEGDEYDEGEEEEDDDDELDDEDGFDDEIITEEYRMKEGRRMFQIFAARMFEQRVLTAYREKVAQEKQAQLLRELEDEDRLAQERELKKVKDAQKKKEKKKAQKQQKDQEVAKKLKDKELEEAATKAAEEAKLEAERRKQEEQRVKREAQRKLQEAERAKKEEERRKRIDEEARKRREKEEKARIEKEAKMAREKEERERKAKEEAERKAKAEVERKEREAREAKAREEAERKRLAEAEKREAEELARREAAKTAAAKLAAQNKNAAAAAAAMAATNKSQQMQQQPQPQQQPHRSPVSVRPPMTIKTMNTASKAPTPNPPLVPMSVPSYPPHTPNRQMLPQSMIPRQMSIGIGLGRPASAAAAPPFSAAVPPMAGPSSYGSIPPRPPSAQYGSSFPVTNAYGHPGGMPPDMHMAMNGGMQSPMVGGPFMPMGGSFGQGPMGPMMQPMNNRAFSGSAVPPVVPAHHYVNPPHHHHHHHHQQQHHHQHHQQPQHASQPAHRPSLVSSIPPSTPTHPTGIISPSLSSATSPLSALHLGSEPVRKASASAVGPIGPSSSATHHRRPSGFEEGVFQQQQQMPAGMFGGSIGPIGRPKANGGMVEAVVSGSSDVESSAASAAGSPTRVLLGSSALLRDDDAGVSFPRRHTLPTNMAPAGSEGAFGGTGVPPVPPSATLGVGSSIWGSAPLGGIGDAGWGTSVVASGPSQTHASGTGSGTTRESTSDWIRRRAISAYCNMGLNEKWIPVGDVSIEMQRMFPDTCKVGLKDMVDACLAGRIIGGSGTGGGWEFSQQGTVLYTRWVAGTTRNLGSVSGGTGGINGSGIVSGIGIGSGSVIGSGGI